MLKASGGGEATAEQVGAVKAAKEMTLGLLVDAFPNVKDVTKELTRGMRFWEMVSLPLLSLHNGPDDDVG